MIRFDDAGTIKKVRNHFSGIRVERVVSPVMSRAGGNMMRTARDLAPKGKHLTKSKSNSPLYADSIFFKKDGPYAVEVFALKSRKDQQGGLARILEYGYPPNNTRPHPHFMPALERETDPTVKWLGRVIGEALKR